MKHLLVKDRKDLIRDADSKAILSRDEFLLNKYKEEREFKLKLSTVVEEHQQLKDDMNEIKTMLKELLGKV
jgi:hypothetical protein